MNHEARKYEFYNATINFLSFILMCLGSSVDIVWVFTNANCYKQVLNISMFTISCVTIGYYLIYLILLLWLDEVRNERAIMYTKMSHFIFHALNAMAMMPLLMTIHVVHINECDKWFEMYLWVRLSFGILYSILVMIVMWYTVLKEPSYRYEVLRSTY